MAAHIQDIHIYATPVAAYDDAGCNMLCMYIGMGLLVNLSKPWKSRKYFPNSVTSA